MQERMRSASRQRATGSSEVPTLAPVPVLAPGCVAPAPVPKACRASGVAALLLPALPLLVPWPGVPGPAGAAAAACFCARLRPWPGPAPSRNSAVGTNCLTITSGLTCACWSVTRGLKVVINQDSSCVRVALRHTWPLQWRWMEMAAAVRRLASPRAARSARTSARSSSLAACEKVRV